MQPSDSGNIVLMIKPEDFVEVIRTESRMGFCRYYMQYRGMRHPDIDKLKAVASAFLYGTSSFSMAFVNKALMTSYSFDFPVIIMVMRMLFSIILLEVLSYLKLIKISPYSVSKGKSFALPSLFYGLNSVLGLKALSHMNVVMFGVVKQCIPFVTMILSCFVLKSGLPSNKTILSVIMITCGCFIAGYGDTTFNTNAYLCGALCNMTQSSYLLLVQRLKGTSTNAIEMLQINSYNTLPFLMLYSVFNSETEIFIQYKHLSERNFLLLFLAAISVGCLFNFSVFLCTEMTSALTTSVVGGMKTMAQTIVGSFQFEGISNNAETYTGICLNLSGTALYIYSKYKNKNKHRIIAMDAPTLVRNSYENP